jgi:formamidopyrimidine-DNA glycosylase
MPELPEVEVAARNLERWALGRRVTAVRAARSRILRPASPARLTALRGARFTDVRRVGKNLLITLAAKTPGKAAAGGRAIGLWSHLGMTGKWLHRRAQDPPPRFSRVALVLDDGWTLHYCDMRLFGRLQLVPGAQFGEITKALGPDPLNDGIDVPALHRRLSAIGQPIKVALMDQRLLPGVGNIQASEALFRARIDPRRKAASITRAETGKIAKAVLASIDHTLAEFAAEGAVGPDAKADVSYVEEPGGPNPFLVYGRAHERCPRCKKADIQRIVQAQRSTFFCPRCQL